MTEPPERTVTGEILPPEPGPISKAVARLSRGTSIPAPLAELLGGSLGDAVAAAAQYAGDSLSPRTREKYLRRWEAFGRWCRNCGADPGELPIHPLLVAAYLADRAAIAGRSALGGDLAAIAHHHRTRGVDWQGNHPAIRETLSGIHRAHNVPVRPAAALTSVEVRKLIEGCVEDAAGTRDRALLLVGLAGALRRSELIGIDREHLRLTDDGLALHIPRSKRDQEGRGADILLPRMRGEATCPVRAMEHWLRMSRITRGPVFRGVTRHGTIEGRLSGEGVRQILLRRAKAAALVVVEAERLSPHGLRAGFITEGYLAGATDEQVMAHARQTDFATTRGYRRRAKITTDNPARLLDL